MSFFEGKVAVITGAGGSIGAAIAKELVKNGAKVSLVDYDEAAMERVVSELGFQPGQYCCIKADVSKEEDVENYVNKTIELLGGLDLFVNNAGVEGDKCDLIDYSTAAFERVLNVNFKGAFFGLKYVIKAMRQAGTAGAIVNTGSCASLKGMPMTIAYVGSKHAVYGMTKTAAVESAKYGIRVNCVCPANVDGPMMRRFEERECRSLGLEVNEENMAKVKAMGAACSPISRYCQPVEIAQGVMYLLNNEVSGFVTGIALPIDGGLTL
jgi:NAD(P)-dependent dehydrogenase (short-subunit alcohol dehydrogenase family)